MVGEAPDHDSAISMATELRPAVVITELRAETIDGPGLLEQLREEHPETVLFVLTESDRNSDITEAVAAGANGFMLVNKVDERWCGFQRIRMRRSRLCEEHLGAGVAVVEDVAAISGRHVGMGLDDIVEHFTGGDANVVGA